MIIDQSNMHIAYLNSLTECKIKNYTCYYNQVQASLKIQQIFQEHLVAPLLLAQPQQGKTGVCIHLIDWFKKDCLDKQLSYEIIVLSHASDNDLLDQWDNGLNLADINHKLKEKVDSCEISLFHFDSVKGEFPKLTLDMTKDKRLIILDECHIALRKSTDEKIAPLDEFLKKSGIYYDKPLSEWDNKNTFLLSVSATPFPQVLKAQEISDHFEFVKLEQSLVYYGIENLINDNRLFQSEVLVKKDRKTKIVEVTQFTKDRLEEFKNYCQINGNKYLIIRLIGEEKVDKIETYIRNIHPEFGFKPFESRNNTDSDWQKALDQQISTEPDQPYVILIKGALRCGKTLSTTAHIGMWVESKNSKGSTTIQSVGRLMGNPIGKASEQEIRAFYDRSKSNIEIYKRYLDENNLRLKHFDTFPIYCNTKEMQHFIDFYCNDKKMIPSSPWNTQSGTSLKEIYEWSEPIIFDPKYYNYDLETLKKEAEKYIIDIDPSFGFGYLTYKRCSTNKNQDVAGDYLNAKVRDTGSKNNSKDKKSIPLYYFDDSNVNFQQSYNDLPNEIKGKVVLKIPIRVIPNKDAEHHENSLFHYNDIEQTEIENKSFEKDNEEVKIVLSSKDQNLLDLSVKKIANKAHETGVVISRIDVLPVKKIFGTSFNKLWATHSRSIYLKDITNFPKKLMNEITISPKVKIEIN